MILLCYDICAVYENVFAIVGNVCVFAGGRLSALRFPIFIDNCFLPIRVCVCVCVQVLTVTGLKFKNNCFLQCSSFL